MSPRRALLLSLALTLPVLGGCGGLGISEAAMAHNRAGADLLAVGDLDAAEARFRLALEHRPGFSEARANLALVAAERGHLAEAERHAKDALESNPDFALGWSTLGLVQERRGALDDAEESYARALENRPRPAHRPAQPRPSAHSKGALRRGPRPPAPPP